MKKKISDIVESIKAIMTNVEQVKFGRALDDILSLDAKLRQNITNDEKKEALYEAEKFERKRSQERLKK